MPLSALLFSVFKVGLLTFGGGYVILGQMMSEFVDRHGWMTKEELTDIFIIAQSTPGLIAVNAAFLVGHKFHGRKGAVLAGLGVVVPPFLVMLVVTLLYEFIIDNPWATGAMRGIRTAIAAILLSTLLTLGQTILKRVVSWIIFATVLTLMLLTALNVLWLMAAGIVAGLIFMPRTEVKHDT